MSASVEAAKALRKDLRRRKSKIADGSVMRFQRLGSNGVRYTYAAVYHQGWWYTTSAVPEYVAKRMNHEAMLALLEDRTVKNAVIAATFEPVFTR